MMAELEEAGGDPDRQLAALVSYDRRLFERCGEHNWRRIFTSWPASAFADGVDVDSAVDTYAAICNVDVYDTLIEGTRLATGAGRAVVAPLAVPAAAQLDAAQEYSTFGRPLRPS